ncbi:NAD-glutamate dehydrogenase domain-containing protein [Novosphingobium sp. Leaf2]|uniref:NAD-glutamate dehydrogenase domain-containing protein n=1 Tax=Novosphingobium sp. Leaf2 TaxID=1735670 RepID=UPI0006F8C7D5|nr:NAD-glutamate dehydrogenase domain-containing protein [Novosphingobium sp. Leaf2]KQM19666.1 glutamate dehydrogenase [Novosphingobium sp. Leaf2]
MSEGDVDVSKKASKKRGGHPPDALHAGLCDELRATVLPGEEADGTWIEEAARFLLAAADQRAPGKTAIDVTSASEERRILRIALINDDMPFLVDSAAAAVAQAGLVIDRLAHPVIPVRRDGDGKLLELPAGPDGATARESMIYIETPRADARQRRELLRSLETTFADVRAAVADWQAMVAAMRADADRADGAGIGDTEGAELLRWLADGMLTQIGHVTRHRDGTRTQPLGVCRDAPEDLLSDQSYARAFAVFDAQLAEGAIRAPLVVKANRMSTVHRRVPMDLFLVPVIKAGKVTALSVHAGIWTSAALAAPPSRVPRLRRHFSEMAARLELDPVGHTGKALAHALTSLPHDLVLGFAQEDVERLAMMMTGLVDRPRPRLLLARSPLMRHLFAFVWLPRDLLSTQMQKRIQHMIEEAAQAPTLDWSMQVEAGNLAMLRYTLDVREGAQEPSEDELDGALQVILRGWTQAVEAALATTLEPGRAAAVAARYAEAFPIGYRSEFGAAEAATDIAYLRRIAVGEGAGTAEVEAAHRDVRFHAREGDPENWLRLKIYQSEGGLALSDAVPALENFGFRVMAEVPTPLEKGALGTIHDFLVETADGRAPGDVLNRAAAIEDALRSVLNGSGENDAFNRLVPALGLSSTEVNWLRAWYRYLRQAGTHFGIPTVVDALEGAAGVTVGIVALFKALHDPAFAGDRIKARKEAEDAIRNGLAGVSAINDDRVLRAYRDIVLAMLRTNAFAPAGEVALAFKFDSAQVPGLPKPLPWREIFIYSQRVEGIHLRAGPVARGGLRWSDRRDDFRTEVLGLMKAQRVKNAVIVPTGAKGGFYPKQLPDPARDRAAWAAEGQASYEVFVDTLLSITDNIVNDKVAHPESVVVLDGEDPYFVVAADKGTAKFSDVANAIAEARDFWLDDAFASGGSNGYDHKAMGITAKGAWLSVQRHFLELGVDVQADPVRVVGCGDMSGDVFGNGMLLSKSLRLVAAFDHRHIFLDPTPDPKASWEERARLFDLPVSSWNDYDKALISPGGGVFPRSMKSIPLSEEVRSVLGLTQAEIDPDALITAILCAPVDLLWFGGIGTYVKASAENNVQVGDPTNDALRVSGNELRVRVVGEGANLGVTQAGRIEFATRGGRINTDFIDNSAGVDCSDNEVNIKIALAAAKRAGKLTEPKRVELLRDMTDEVATLVLEDNRLQALALSIAERGGAQASPSHIRLIETMGDSGYLDRRTEGLPDNDVLVRRAQDGRGLTRPELAVLLSSGKLQMQAAIEDSTLPSDPGLTDLLLSAFPTQMQHKFAKFIKGHRLAREIIATKLANRVINRLGIVIPFELAEEEGTDLSQVAAAFALADRLFDLSALWERLEVAPMAETTRVALFETVALAVRGHMADLLRAGAGQIAPSELADRLQKGIAALSTDTLDLLGERTLAHSRKLRDGLTQMGAPDDMAAQVANLFDLDGAVGIASLAAETGIAPRRLVTAFTRVGAGLGLDWAQANAAMMSPSDPWERLLVAGLARDFQQMRLDFLRGLARTKAGKADPLAATEEWGRQHAAAITAFRGIVHRAESAVAITPAMLAQIASQARNLLGR